MSKQQHSASLQIVEINQQLIDITQNSFQVEIQQEQQFFQPQKIDDTFELSLDQNSLSFHIQDLKEQSNCQRVLKQQTINLQIKQIDVKPAIIEQQQRKPIPVVQQQRKRKRRQIFQKYKQKTTQNILADPQIQPRTNDIMNTFDQIFRIKSPQKPQKTQINNPVILKKNSQPSSIIQTTSFRKKQSAFGLAATSFEQISGTGSQLKNVPPLVCKVSSKFSISQFQIPSTVTELQTDPESNLVIGNTHSFIIESQDNKISMIYPEEEQVSRDSGDIQSFLKSELFRQDILQKTIHKDDITYKNIEISTVNPSIMINAQNQSPNNKNLNIEERFGLTRDKSQAFLPAQNKQILRRNLSQRKLQPFQNIRIQPNTIVKEKVNNYQEYRIPVYLREIRRKNTIYPNFYIKSKNKDFYQQQNRAFQELLSQFKKGLGFLDFINQLAYERYSTLTSLQKILLNSLNLNSFLTCGWEKVYPLKQVQNLKPHQNFIKRKYEYQKVKGALSNYLYIVQYYQKCNLNLQDQKARKKYFQIRSKFWQIEKNIKMIGQDIYLLAVEQIFPSHYYEFLKVLKGQTQRFDKPYKQLQYARNLLTKYYALSKQGDILCLSQVGKCVKYRLEKMIQRLLMI